jgi:N-acetyl-alpha-D-muramate 1-phosphate uridylyltransferase
MSATAADEAPRTAMILAAGRGERMRPLTDTVPKPMLRIGAYPLIHFHVVALARAGIRSLVINLAWLGEQVRDYLQDGSRYGLVIHYSDEPPGALQTGGGIFRALRWLTPGPFAVINGDIFCNFPYESLRIAADADAHLVLVPNPPQHAQGDFGFDGRHALANAETRYTFAGIGVYRPAFFAGCIDGRFELKPLLLRSMRAQRCTAEIFRGEWTDVGTPERLQGLQQQRV